MRTPTTNSKRDWVGAALLTLAIVAGVASVFVHLRAAVRELPTQTRTAQ